MNNYCKRSFRTTPAQLFLCGCATVLYGVAPPELPGNDISHIVQNVAVSSDSAALSAPDSTSMGWVDRGVRTWNAPPLQQQLTEDETSIPMGKGFVFVPRMSESNLEPDIEVLDAGGSILKKGKPGRKFAFEPGTYSVAIGSGSSEQRIVRTVTIAENAPAVISPDWAGLSIDVVNENSLPFRGEYELVRIDDFEPFGRAYGRNPDEETKTWILKPGLYKIFGVGESYNALTNFVTVRLMPGTFTRFLLVETADFKIISGGEAVLSSGTVFNSNWKYTLDMGGSLLLSKLVDRVNTTKNQTDNFSIALLFNTSLVYTKSPFEWTTKLLVDEELNFEGFNLANLSLSIENVRLASLAIWRFISWLGPYTSAEVNTRLFPEFNRIGGDVPTHAMVVLSADSTVDSIDVALHAFAVKPPFSPVSLKAGAGVTADVINVRFLEARIRTGFGVSLENIWNKYAVMGQQQIDTFIVHHPADFDSIDSLPAYRVGYIRVPDVFNQKYGPEIALNAEARLGKWVVAEIEATALAPIHRITHPDISVATTVSWRITRSVTLDYQFKYDLSLDEDPAITVPLRDESLHRVIVRFSFSNR